MPKAKPYTPHAAIKLCKDDDRLIDDDRFIATAQALAAAEEELDDLRFQLTCVKSTIKRIFVTANTTALDLDELRLAMAEAEAK
jgi:hypothetical protein